jgi:uncharacterized SAM-binding protein YcdF (DUF218 family)
VFLLAKIIGAMFLPPGIFALLLAAAIGLILLGKRKAGAAFLAACLLLFCLLSARVVADLLIAPLEGRYPPLAPNATPAAKAVVVLGGGVIDVSPEYGGRPSLAPAALKRVAFAAEIARSRGLPLVFSGGSPFSSEGTGLEAEAALAFWERLGILRNRITLEAKSRDTAESAAAVASLGIGGPFLLVTSAFHMPRAMLAFGKAGEQAIPAPTDYRRGDRAWRSILDFLPSADALLEANLALHEYLSLLYYRLRRFPPLDPSR